MANEEDFDMVTSYEEWASRRWDNDLVQNADVVRGHPFNAGNANKMFEQITKTRSADGATTSINNKSIKTTLETATEESLWNMLKRIKKITDGDEHMVLHSVGFTTEARYREMIACIFYKTVSKATIYTNDNIKTNSEAKTRNTYALIVDGGRETNFNAVLKVKQAVAAHPASKAIKTIRGTKDGSVIITTHNTLEVKQRKDGVKETTVLSIRDMDAETNTIDIDAATNEICRGKATIKMSNLIPYARNTQAVTITISHSVGVTLITKIGFNNCTMEKTNRHYAMSQVLTFWR